MLTPIKKQSNITLRNAAQPVEQSESITTVTPTWSTSVSINDINSTDVGRLLASENEAKRNMSIQKWLDNIVKRHDIRMSMAKWWITSGNKNTDKLEDARSALADYARLAYIEEAKKDSSMDLWVIESMKDQDIIDRMTKDDPVAQQTYIDFINKWWFVSEVYKSMMWIDEEAQRKEELANAWWWENFWKSAVSEIPRQVAWLLDITGVTDYFNNKEKEKLDVYNQVSTDEYNRYKNWEISKDELKNNWTLWVYNDYENDVNNWDFVGSIEEYWKAMYDRWMNEFNQSAQEQILKDSLYEYDENGKWVWAGKFATQMAEFMVMPWSQLWWLWNTILWTAEILWLNTLSEWKLPTKWEAAATAWITAALELLLRIPWGVKFIRSLLSNTSPEVKNALSKTTVKTWKEYEKVIKSWLTATKNEATKMLDKAAQWIKWNLKWASWKLKKLRSWMEWDFKIKDYFDSINQRFKNFETEWGWGANSAPEIILDDAGNMTIYNEEALSNVADSNWKKLVDYIKWEWEAFRNQGRDDTIRNAEDFMRKLSDKIYELSSKEWWINSTDSAVKAVLEWTKDAYEKVYDAMWNIKWWQFKKARERYSKLKDYEEFFEKYIWNIRGKKSPLNDLEKTRWGEKSMWKWWDYLWEFMKLLKKDKVVKDDIGSQLLSLIYAYGIKDPKKVQELIETIYPSWPWVQEVWLTLLRRWLKNSEAETLLKDATPWKLDVWEWINKIVRPATQVWEERLLEY